MQHEYEGDLQPLLEELAALREALGESYVDLGTAVTRGSLFPPSAPSTAAPAPPTTAPTTTSLSLPSSSPHPPRKPAPRSVRLKAVTEALESNRALKDRLQRLLTSIARAQDQANDLNAKVKDIIQKRESAPIVRAVKRRTEYFSGVSWFWVNNSGAPPPPAYPDPHRTALKHVMDAVPFVVPRVQFSEGERAALCEGVLQVVQEKQLDALLQEFEQQRGGGGEEGGEEGGAALVVNEEEERRRQEGEANLRIEEFKAKQLPIRMLAVDSPEVEAAANAFTEENWATVAQRAAPTRAALDCKLQWFNSACPSLSQKHFTHEEDKKLQELVAAHGPRAWTRVAQDLGDTSGTGRRTPLQCMGRYRQLEQEKNRTKMELSAEDTARLFAIVHRLGANWRRVAEEFGGGLEPEQIMHKYRRLAQMHEKVGGQRIPPRKGTWSKEEDRLLLTAVALYEKKWSLVAKMVPGRSDVQCRERYVNCLDPTIKSGLPWTQEEDETLLSGATEHTTPGGKIRWAKVAGRLSGRTDNMCLKRYLLLMGDGGKRVRTKDGSVSSGGEGQPQGSTQNKKEVVDVDVDVEEKGGGRSVVKKKRKRTVIEKEYDVVDTSEEEEEEEEEGEEYNGNVDHATGEGNGADMEVAFALATKKTKSGRQSGPPARLRE